MNGLEYLRKKGIALLLYQLTIYKMDDSLEEMIGRYGMMRESFLKEHQHGIYIAMLLMGKLTAHLREIVYQ